MMLWVDPRSALQNVEKIAAIGVALSSLEYLVYHRLFKDSALMSWPVSRLLHRRLTEGIVSTILNSLLCYPTILVLIALQLLFAVSLIITTFYGLFHSLVLIGIAAISILLRARSPYSSEGADSLSIIVFSTLGLAASINTPLIGSVCLWFIAFQSCSCYCAGGIAKAMSPEWRSGQALPGIFSMAAYGNTTIAAFLSAHPLFNRLITWSFIAIEILMPVALLGPKWVTFLFLLWGVGFHVFSAITMGLNGFVWSFLATYPAIWYCSGAK